METGYQDFGNLSENPVIDNVFSIDLIFEEILKLLIFDNDLKINHKMVQTLRLVNKHWLSTVSTLLKRSSTPLFVIRTDIPRYYKKEILLNQIYPSLTSPKRLRNSLLPFKLILKRNYFIKKNQQTLLKCLTPLGDELVELKVYFLEDRGENSLVFSQLTLPLLRKFSFKVFKKTKKAFLLMQQILNASENLQDFVFKYTGYSHFTDNFEGLKIPKSVLSVEIDDMLNRKYVKTLLMNNLPNLNHLGINMQTTILESEMMMFEILERFQRSLVSLKLTCQSMDGVQNILKFPKLEKLEKLQINGTDYGFEPQCTSNLQKLLPSAKTCKFNNNKSVSVEELSEVHAALPNISRLTINVKIDGISKILGVIMNMTQLKSLRFNVRQEMEIKDVTSYNAILMGLPAWLISGHKVDSDFFQSFLRKRGRKISLLNLSELTSFTLWIQTSSCITIDAKYYANNFADLLFTQTLINMPKLRIVTFSENLQHPTQQIQEIWKAKGCSIEYIGIKD